MAVDAIETSAGADGPGADMALDEVGGVGARGAGKALYRRYRPQTFEEVIGQEHVTEPLMQALRTGRFGHAYLFSGPRGCGKTTSARILARCLNCEQGPTATPCGECASCIALATGGSGSVDVIEIDAASHGGVDDARDLREKASYGPAQSRYKVYIIDEAHMVTPQGFNALLKIVEEPPEHVKFVFATTEPEKVIGTIRSRTHHYPFRLVPPARLQEYLAHLCEAEGIPVEPGVLSFVIRAGGGSVRDSLSVLDQLMAGSTQEGLTYAGAAALLGFTEGELLDATIGALAARDGAGVFRQVDRTIETGQDPRRFVEDLLERLRDLIVVAAVGASGGDISALFRGVPSDQIERMRQQAAAFGPGELSHAADVVNTGLTEMTGATSPRLQLELICARLLLPASAGEHGIVARVDRIERRLDLSGADPVGPPPRDVRHAPSPPSAPQGGQAPVPGSGGSSASPPAGGSPGDAVSRGGESERSTGRPSATERDSAPGVASTPSTPSSAASSVEARDPVDQRNEGNEGTQSGGRRDTPAPAETSSDADASRPAAQQTPPPPPQEARRAPGGLDTDASRPAAQQTPPPPPQEARRAPGGLDTDAIRRSWPDVLAKVFSIRRVTWTFLSEHAQVLDYDGTRLLLGISTRGLATTFRGGQHGEVVRQALIEAIGLDTRVEAIPADEARGGGQDPSGGPRPGGSGPSGAGPGGPGSGGPGSGGPGSGGAGSGGPAASGGAPSGRAGAPRDCRAASAPSAPTTGSPGGGASSSADPRDPRAPQRSAPSSRAATSPAAATGASGGDAGLEGLRAGAHASRAAERATGWQGGDDAPDWAQVEPPHDDDAWITPPAPGTTHRAPTPRAAEPANHRPARAAASEIRSTQTSGAQTPNEGLGSGALAAESPGPAIAERDGELDGPPGAGGVSDSASYSSKPGPSTALRTSRTSGTSSDSGNTSSDSNDSGNSSTSGIAAFRRARADQARRAQPGLGGRSGPASGAAAGAKGAGPSTRQGPSGSADQASGARNAGTGDDEVSEDDEVIEDLSAVGQPVIASVLGGVVIDENTT